ncbi:hypothetical protein O1L55_06825 [Streptomyces albulus]|nr:hypothetical protein [Streptomyces noursei]
MPPRSSSEVKESEPSLPRTYVTVEVLPVHPGPCSPSGLSRRTSLSPVADTSFDAARQRSSTTS